MTTTPTRDLAWCRAAFRDLDAPVAGLGPLPAPPAPGPSAARRSWASGPIGPGPGATPLPATTAVLAHAGVASGVAPRRVDTVGARLLVWDEVTRVGVELLRAEPAAARALRTVRARWDLEEAMLWHVLTHHGPAGLAARREVERRLYAEGGLRRLLAEAIDSGLLLRY